MPNTTAEDITQGLINEDPIYNENMLLGDLQADVYYDFFNMLGFNDVENADIQTVTALNLSFSGSEELITIYINPKLNISLNADENLNAYKIISENLLNCLTGKNFLALKLSNDESDLLSNESIKHFFIGKIFDLLEQNLQEKISNNLIKYQTLSNKQLQEICLISAYSNYSYLDAVIVNKTLSQKVFIADLAVDFVNAFSRIYKINDFSYNLQVNPFFKYLSSDDKVTGILKKQQPKNSDLLHLMKTLKYFIKALSDSQKDVSVGMILKIAEYPIVKAKLQDFLFSCISAKLKFIEKNGKLDVQEDQRKQIFRFIEHEIDSEINQKNLFIIAKYWQPFFDTIDIETVKHLLAAFVKNLVGESDVGKDKFHIVLYKIFQQEVYIAQLRPYINSLLTSEEENIICVNEILRLIHNFNIQRYDEDQEFVQILTKISLNSKQMQSSRIHALKILATVKNCSSKLDLLENLTDLDRKIVFCTLKIYERIETRSEISQKLIEKLHQYLASYPIEFQSKESSTLIVKIIQNLSKIYPREDFVDSQLRILEEYPLPNFAPDCDYLLDAEFLQKYEQEQKIYKNKQQLLAELAQLNKPGSIIACMIKDGSLERSYNHIKDWKYKPSSILSSDKPIFEWNDSDFKLWANKVKEVLKADMFRKLLQPLSKEVVVDSISKEEIIAIICQANFRTTGFEPRDIQIFSLLNIIASEKKGIMLQISTGEGKSTITAMSAAFKGIMGNKVDVITSSTSLAKRDAEERKKFFNLLGLSVADNSQITEEYKSCYGADIVYGNASNFQYDILKHEFLGKNIRGNRCFSVAIVDEVDSMLIDESGKMAMLSSPVAGSNFLAPFYAKIWSNIAIISENIIEKNGKYFFIHEELLEADQVNELEDGHKEQKINKIEIHVENKREFIKNMISSDIDENLDKGKYYTPTHLKQFVQKQARFWIDSAFRALEMQLGKDYIITENEYRNKVIYPVAFSNTGSVSVGSSWGDGLHQFLQIKHSLKLTSETITTNYLSNYSFFKRYGPNIFGMTGTLGDKQEQQLLKDSYDIDFSFIPTFKQKRFTNQSLLIAESEQKWMQSLVNRTEEIIEEKRAILLICNSIYDASSIHSHLVSKHPTAQLYTRDDNDEKENISNQLNPGQIIVATNLAGRGTDLKISKTVAKNGGLHVLITYLPLNLRVEEQAFGRTSRSGAEGSGEIILNAEQYPHIFQNEEYKLLNIASSTKDKVAFVRYMRDEIEAIRLRDITNSTLPKIEIEEELFSKFCGLIKLLKEQRNAKNKPTQVIESWGFLLKQIKQTWAEFDELDESDAAIDLNIYFEKFNLTEYEITAPPFEDEDIDDKIKLPEEKIEQPDPYENFTLNQKKREIALELYKKFEKDVKNKFPGNYKIYKNPSIIVRHGLNLMNIERYYIDAINHFKEAYKIDPIFALPAQYNLAYTLIKKGGIDSARKNERDMEYIVEALNALNLSKNLIENVMDPLHKILLTMIPLQEGGQLLDQVQNKIHILDILLKHINDNIKKIESITHKEYVALNTSKSLHEFFDHDLAPMEEIFVFNSIGINAVFEVEGCRFTPNYFAIGAAIVIGVAYIAFGLMALSCGDPFNGVSFIYSGLQDLNSAIKMYNLDQTGTEYFSQRVISLGLDFICVKVGNHFKAADQVKAQTIPEKFADIFKNASSAAPSFKEKAAYAAIVKVTENGTKQVSEKILTQVADEAVKKANQDVAMQAVQVCLSIGATALTGVFAQKIFEQTDLKECSKRVGEELKKQIDENLANEEFAKKLRHLIILDSFNNGSSNYQKIFNAALEALEQDEIYIEQAARIAINNSYFPDRDLATNIIGKFVLHTFVSTPAYYRILEVGKNVNKRFNHEVEWRYKSAKSLEQLIFEQMPEHHDKADIKAVLDELINAKIISEQYEISDNFDDKIEALSLHSKYDEIKSSLLFIFAKLHAQQNADFSNKFSYLSERIAEVVEQKVEYSIQSEVLSPTIAGPLQAIVREGFDRSIAGIKNLRDAIHAKISGRNLANEATTNTNQTDEQFNEEFEELVRDHFATNQEYTTHRNETAEPAAPKTIKKQAEISEVAKGFSIAPLLAAPTDAISVDQSSVCKYTVKKEDDGYFTLSFEDENCTTIFPGSFGPTDPSSLSSADLKNQYDNLTLLEKYLPKTLSGISQKNQSILYEYNRRLENDVSFSNYVKQAKMEANYKDLLYYSALDLGNGSSIFLDKEQAKRYDLSLYRAARTPLKIAGTAVSNAVIKPVSVVSEYVGGKWEYVIENVPIMREHPGLVYVFSTTGAGAWAGLRAGGPPGAFFGAGYGFGTGIYSISLGSLIDHIAGEKIGEAIKKTAKVIDYFVRQLPDVTKEESANFTAAALVVTSAAINVKDLRQIGRNASNISQKRNIFTQEVGSEVPKEIKVLSKTVSNDTPANTGTIEKVREIQSKPAANKQPPTTKIIDARELVVEQVEGKAVKPKKVAVEKISKQVEQVPVEASSGRVKVEITLPKIEKGLHMLAGKYLPKYQYQKMDRYLKKQMRELSTEIAEFTAECIKDLKPGTEIYQNEVKKLTEWLAKYRVDDKVIGIAQQTDKGGMHKGAIELITKYYRMQKETKVIYRNLGIVGIMGKKLDKNYRGDLVIVNKNREITFIEMVSEGSQTVKEMDKKLEWMKEQFDKKGVYKITEYEVYTPTTAYDEFAETAAQYFKELKK